MEKDKSRGLKHIKDKKKYKPVKQPVITQAQKKKPSLESNWDRYEREEEDVYTVSSSTDFSVLANAPIAQGSHFQFKSDKELSELELDNSENLDKDIFDLDLNLLGLSISTIPFYEKHNFLNSYFTDNDRLKMKAKAKDNSIIYQEYLETNKLSKKGSNLPQKEENEDFDLLLQATDNLKVTENSAKSCPESISKDPEDLESWLDDILED